MSVRTLRCCAAALGVLWCASAHAQTVSLSGSMGNKALLVIDGAPRTLAAGAAHNGVKLVSVNANDAVVEINGTPVPLMSGPLVPPAEDYPHHPRFDYQDGPDSLGVSALEAFYTGGRAMLA